MYDKMPMNLSAKSDMIAVFSVNYGEKIRYWKFFLENATKKCFCQVFLDKLWKFS